MTDDREETSPETAPEGPSAEASPEDTGMEPTEEAPLAPEGAEGIPPEGPATAPAEAATVDEDGTGKPPAPEATPPAGGPVEEALPVVEALLFAASKPVPVEKLAEAAELPAEAVEAALSALEAACAADGRGVRLDRVAGGVRLVSRPEYDYPVRRLLGLDGRTKLSMAALETLAIVAYRQPVTGPEVAELRGVNSSSSIRTLLDRKLITTAGRKEVVGTPFLYKTTKEFLVHFGLKGLSDLPKPEELEAIYGLEAPRPDPAQVELFHVDEATGELEEPAGGAPDGTTPAAERSPEASDARGAPAPGTADAADDAAPSLEPGEAPGVPDGVAAVAEGEVPGGAPAEEEEP